LLFTAYRMDDPAWQNMEHFAETAVPLDRDLDTFGRDLAQNMLLWQAQQEVLFHRGLQFRTDWYQELASMLMASSHSNSSSASSASTILACEDLFAQQQCFEQLVIYRKPTAPFVTTDRPSAHRLQRRALQRYHLQPVRPSASPYRVLVLLRVDEDGWSNYLEAGEAIEQHVAGFGGIANVELLDRVDLMLSEQVRWFSEASIFVSTHGSHQTNVLFMSEGAVFMEYFKPQCFSWAFAAIAAARGVTYHAVHAADTNVSQCFSRENMSARLPLDFDEELAPHFEMALEGLSDADGDSSCQYVAYGRKCHANLWQAGQYYEQLLPSHCHIAGGFPGRSFATLETARASPEVVV